LEPSFLKLLVYRRAIGKPLMFLPGPKTHYHNFYFAITEVFSNGLALSLLMASNGSIGFFYPGISFSCVFIGLDGYAAKGNYLQAIGHPLTNYGFVVFA
jgi:hypothetical protein